MLATTPSHLAVKDGKYTHFLTATDIVYLQAEGAYTRLHLTENRELVLSKKLKEVSEILVEYPFFRIHHGFAINLGHLVKYCNHSENYVEMSNGSRLPLAKSRKGDFFALFTKM